MSTAAETDRADPAVRAAGRVTAREVRESTLRTSAALTLVVLAAVGTFVAEPITGGAGATVGAVVAGLLLLLLAVAIWPQDWTADERQHRHLEAIWREIRSDADATVPWERYAAWAEPDGRRVKVLLITCHPPRADHSAAPSPYGLRLVRRFGGDEVEAAAGAMELLRAEASQRELEARQRFEAERFQIEQAAHEQKLRAIEEQTAAEIAANEKRLRREMAAQEEAEQKAQAEALARALRRP